MITVSEIYKNETKFASNIVLGKLIKWIFYGS